MESVTMDALLVRQLEVLFDLQLKKIRNECSILNDSLDGLKSEIQMLKRQMNEFKSRPEPALQAQSAPLVQEAQKPDPFTPGNVPIDKLFYYGK